MRNLATLLILFLSLCLSSCASAPTREELENADFGSPPSNHQETIKSYIGSQLKDPYSAQYNFRSGPK